MSDQTLAFLDIETTGLNPFRHEVLEVAYVRELESGSYDETYFSLPINERIAEPEALKINRYHERKAELRAAQIAPVDAVRRLLEELSGAMIVAANPTFDVTFLRHFLWRWAGAEPTWYYRSIDLNTLASGWLHSPRIFKTAAVAERFDVPLGADQHTALADARWNRDIYNAIVTSDRPIRREHPEDRHQGFSDPMG